MKRINRGTLLTAYATGKRDFRGVSLQGVDLGERSRGESASLALCDFTGADLSRCSFVGTDLRGSIFRRAHLVGCNFARANLIKCDFTDALLFDANLNLADCNAANFTAATLSCASLAGTDLSDATLTDAELYAARLKRVWLSGTKAKRLRLGDTALSELDLSLFARARIEKPEDSCDVDWSAIAESLALPDHELKKFLVRVGMPESIAMWMIEAVRALDTRVLFDMMHSTFISYGVPDETFAIWLRDELSANKVVTFLFRDDAIPGEKLHGMMRSGINKYDRVVLICSRDSLNRPGVLNEIEEALQREARDGGASYLIPIRVDDYVFSGWNPPRTGIAQAVRDRVVGDFRRARNSRTALRKAMPILLKALQKKRNLPPDK